MELFLSANIHQGNDLFSVYSQGTQYAFMCLSALLTAQNNPVIVWSKTKLNNILLQGDSMHLEALKSGLIVPDPGVDLLSINNLPSAVHVTCNTNKIGDIKPTDAQTIIGPPIVVEPIEAQTIIDPPIHKLPAVNLEQKTIKFPIEGFHVCIRVIMWYNLIL